MRKCLGENCQRIITSRFAICQNCEKAYGRRASDWPAWLRFLWKDVQREQRQNRRIRLRETILYNYD